MTTMITRIGKRNDPKRSKVVFKSDLSGCYNVDIQTPKRQYWFNESSFHRSFYMSFWWAGIKLQ